MNKTNSILLILLFFFFFASCKQSPPAQEEETSLPVRTVVVQEKPVIFPVHTSGKLAAKTESRLSFKTGGIIRKIYVDEGQSVEEDQLLAALNLSEIKSRTRQAELALQKAQRDFTRAGNLYRDSVATLEQFQDARTALEVARTNASIAKFNLEYSEIRAPSQGKILKRVAEENEIVGAGHPVFLFASTESAWVVRVNLTDKDIVNVQLGDSASVAFDAYPGKKFASRVSETGNAADPYTGTYEVELHMDELPETLVSGFITRVDIYPAGNMKKMIIIPVEALIDGQGMTGTCYVIRDGKPVKQTIAIHTLTDTGIVVSSGLEDGDEVIIEGGEYVREDITIKREI
jgi:multidrug efflux system membrane fusion protein